MVPPTSMWTGAVYRLAAATHGIPVIGLLWLQPLAEDNPWFPGGDPAVVGVGDDEFDVGDVVGDVLHRFAREVNGRNFNISLRFEP